MKNLINSIRGKLRKKSKTKKSELMKYLKDIIKTAKKDDLYEKEKPMNNIMGLHLSLDEVKYIHKCLKEYKKKL